MPVEAELRDQKADTIPSHLGTIILGNKTLGYQRGAWSMRSYPGQPTLVVVVACCIASFVEIGTATPQEHAGASSYARVCQSCHGPQGDGGLAPSLLPMSYDMDYVMAIVREGYGQMPPISQRELSDEEVTQAVEYLRSVGEAPPAQSATYQGPRTAGGHPDLSGIWQALNAASWNLEAHNAEDGVPAGLSVVVGETIPYQPWASSQRQENFDQRLTADPVRQCFLPGVPRVTYMPFPFQIIQTPDHVVMTYEFAHAVRIIYTDGSPHPLPNDFWMGDSRGHWERDTLVVDTTHFNDRTWFDAAGNFHSTSLHVVERYTPTSPDHLTYEVTIEDPEVFTHPWTIRMPLYRRLEENLQILDYDCVDFFLDEILTPQS